MASLFEDLQQRKQVREQYLADNPNPNRLQPQIDYSPEANRQKVANVAGATGGLYTGSVGLGGDVEGVGKAYNNSAGILDLVKMYASKGLPIPKELKKQIAPNVAKPEFLAELNRIFEESDTFLTNSLDAREDVTNFFSDDGLGNSILKNTPVGNNGIGDLLKEADEGAWLTGEVFAPTKIPKISRGIKNTAEDFIDTGNNIGDKVVDNAVQATKSLKGAGRSIYQTLEEGMSPELVTPDGQTIKASDVELNFDAPMPKEHIKAKVGEHLEHTPKNPNPEVGDRFEVEFAGGLEAKRLADIEAMKNGSILPMIWDSSSANYYIRSVSGHSFKYPKAFMTHGGDDFSRVIKNQEQGIGGASNYEVVKMIRDRVDAVRKLNLEKGGSGDVFLMTRRMAPYRTGGSHPMDFSVQPTQLTLAVLDNQPLSKLDIARVDESIREMPITKTVKEGGKEVKVKTYPFKNFKGIMTPKGRDQLFGLGKVGTSAGNLRKAFMNRMAVKQNQKAFHFNIQDIDMALTDPALRGVPYGYMGNAIIKAPDEGIKIVKGNNASYPYDFGGKYFGTMNHNFHMRTLYGKQYDEVLEELTKKNKTREKPKTMEAVHSQVVDALSKRKDLNQSSVFVNDDVYETLKGLQRPLEQSSESYGLLGKKSLWDYPDQKITSADTSINSSKPATAFTKLLKKDAFKKGSKNLDIGGGRFDNVNTLLEEQAGATNLVYDPWNRSKAHNNNVVKEMAGGKADTVTINNTLNVIEDTPNQIRVLEQAKDAVKENGKVYISVYEGDRTGKGRPTTKGWQRNQKIEDYLETVKQVFPDARIENKIIVIDN